MNQNIIHPKIEPDKFTTGEIIFSIILLIFILILFIIIFKIFPIIGSIILIIMSSLLIGWGFSKKS